MKKCFKCNLEKPLDEFYRHAQTSDGYLNKCKVCTKADVAQNRQENLSDKRRYDKQRSKDPDRRKQIVEFQRKYRANNVAYQVRQMTSNAIRDGKLVRRPCEACGSTRRIHAHHDDYSKPFEVRWLCQKHHKEWHDIHGKIKFNYEQAFDGGVMR